MSDRVIHRLVVPVDDQWHALKPGGRIIHVGTRREDCVEFWVLRDPATYAAPERDFRVFGTGQAIGRDAAHVASVVTPSGVLVWHLFERSA